MTTDQVDTTVPVGKTRRLILRLMGLGGALGAAGAVGAAAVVPAASGSSPQAAPGPGANQYPTNGITLILAVPDAGAALEFYQQAFDAEVLFAAKNPAGEIIHAEFVISGTVVGVTKEAPELGIVAPTSGATPTCAAENVADLEHAIQKVAAAGGNILLEPTPTTDFALHACFQDPFGHNWHMFQPTRSFTADDLRTMIEQDAAGPRYVQD